jgi:signal transduction histidine kinase
MSNDLLDLTQIESGGLMLALEPVALREAVEQVFAMLSAQAQQQGVALELAPGAPLEAETDRTRLRQVLLNLLSNAIKYNRRGGQVTVSVQPGPGGLCLAVRDNGVGMAPEHLARLFEPFQRGAQAASGIEGSGIGLALTRALVRRLGGRLEVESRLGQGSCFSVVLPAAHGADAGR